MNERLFEKSFKVVIIKPKMYVKKPKSLQGKPNFCEAVDGEVERTPQ